MSHECARAHFAVLLSDRCARTGRQPSRPSRSNSQDDPLVGTTVMLLNDILDLSKIETGTWWWTSRAALSACSLRGAHFRQWRGPNVDLACARPELRLAGDGASAAADLKNCCPASPFTHQGLYATVEEAFAGWSAPKRRLLNGSRVWRSRCRTRLGISPTSSRSSSRPSAGAGSPAASPAAPAWPGDQRRAVEVWAARSASFPPGRARLHAVCRWSTWPARAARASRRLPRSPTVSPVPSGLRSRRPAQAWSRRPRTSRGTRSRCRWIRRRSGRDNVANDDRDHIHGGPGDADRGRPTRVTRVLSPRARPRASRAWSHDGGGA